MARRIPKIFYKYRAFNSLTLSMLEKNQVYFPSSHELNDPFDCSIPSATHDILSEKLAEFLGALRLGIKPDALTLDQRQQFKRELNSKIPENGKAVIEVLKELDQLGVLPLSARNDSILMWSHYADSHKGFCIGFSSKLYDTNSDVIQPVVYSNTRNIGEIFDFSNLNQRSFEYFQECMKKLCFFTKAKDWNYEKEWRIMGVASRIVRYSDTSIDRVIFGLKTSSDDKERIKAILSPRHVQYFQAKKSKTDFKIEISQID